MDLTNTRQLTKEIETFLKRKRLSPAVSARHVPTTTDLGAHLQRLVEIK